MTLDFKAFLAKVVAAAQADLQNAPQFLAGLSNALDVAQKDSTTAPLLDKLIPGFSKVEPPVVADMKSVVDFLSKLDPSTIQTVEKVLGFLASALGVTGT